MVRVVRRVLLVLVLLLVVALVGGYLYARPLLLTGTGYAAHNACAVELLAGRDDPQDDLPPNPLVPFLRTSSSKGKVTGSLLGLLAKQTAHFTSGYGCTLGGTPRVPEVPVVTGASPVTDGPPAPELDTAIDRAFGSDLSAGDRAALGTRAVVVVKDGRVVAERYADGFSADTRQLGWSMTKSVTNLLVGRLVAEGRVSVDDDDLRKEWTDGRSRITVDELMRMTSGLAWDETYALGTPITRMLYVENDMGGYVASQPLAHPPGEHLQYSSGSTTLLCDILLDRTGSDASLLHQQLFGPLGLSSFVVEPDASGTPVCSSYGWATPRDWAAIGQLALDDGKVGPRRLLPAGWMRQATTATRAEETEEDQPYGAGWWLNRKADGTAYDDRMPLDTFEALGHDGQSMAVIPSEGLVVLRMGFTPDPDLDDRFGALVRDVVSTLG
ncbi:serine hydrolase domain-containing protein [Nocardioides marmoribigeumensis]|uniref:CubicO group peptidase (Beta-lactamase class C family) n=1 Tax=Nocardioides marmoribigeumensis TaxID=433649 RepID=A0ABU2BZT0_9ACTN|nr:serine hydrolase [Nocardioides marmoribigeumensis]MDR7363899.1 CubicO group peptidase (beta-lactamase class C family) [Nocardioides marmoribigeumensis]